MHRSTLSKSALKAYLSRLYNLPIEFVYWVDPSKQAGWYMHLNKVALKEGVRLPGVYSTSFAIQLLCGSDAAPHDSVRPMIISGMRYLASQLTASNYALLGGDNPSKQQMKKDEVGHTDFQLSMKCISVIEAANAISEIRHRHNDFGRILEEADEVLNSLTQIIKKMAIQWNDHSSGMTYMAWPWHSLGTDNAWDIIPTVHISLALSHPSLRGSARYLDTIQPVVNCIRATVTSDATLVHKAIAYRALAVIEERTEQHLREGIPTNDFIQPLLQAAAEIDEYSWQEVLHYQVPSKVEAISHYKPWIWLCPRIELAECLTLLDSQRPRVVALEVVAEVMSNIGRNGSVQFMNSQPPTLLGNLRSARFLEACNERLVRTNRGQIQFNVVRARVYVKRLIEHNEWLLPAMAVGLIASLFYRQGRSLWEVKEVGNAQDLLSEVIRLIWSVYPIWILLFIGCLILVKGSIRSKVVIFLKLFGGAIFISLLVELLAARKP